ncbi:MAG: transcriptional repressor [Chloroflexi bacterium]|nr:MAG: transcriptional repressor [Chloroflexota bacterium]
MSSSTLDGAIAGLRAAGKRMTAQREAVLAILAEAYPRHLDAAEIFEQARRSLPRINLASVYRTLKVLKELGLVDEISVDDGGRRYGLKRATEQQYHLVCSQCDQVIAVSSPVLEQLREELAKVLPFVVDDLEVNLIGHCDGGETTCKWNASGT